MVPKAPSRSVMWAAHSAVFSSKSHRKITIVPSSCLTRMSCAAALGPWVCHACKEQNEATFEICWRCHKPRDDDDWQGRLQVKEERADAALGPPTVEPVADAIDVDRNPYRPVLLEGDTLRARAKALEVSRLDDAVRRAYGGAIIGTVILPPLLNIYSIFLLLFSEARIAHGDRKYRIRLSLAWVINIASIIGWSVVYSYLGFAF